MGPEGPLEIILIQSAVSVPYGDNECIEQYLTMVSFQ